MRFGLTKTDFNWSPFFCYTTEHIHWLVALIVAEASKKISQFRKEVNAGQQKFFL